MAKRRTRRRKHNEPYQGDYLNRVAFPLGGIGAGMICLEGAGALSHLSLRHEPEVFNEPCMFSAVHVTGEESRSRVLEGPVPGWKLFGNPGTGNGARDKTYGFPRFGEAAFTTRFPFATVELKDQRMPLSATVTGWSPFVPNDADNSSLPLAALEYTFVNTSGEPLEAVFSFNTRNFMEAEADSGSVDSAEGGFVLSQKGTEEEPWKEGHFCAMVDDEAAAVDCRWFRGGWFDPLTLAWKNVEEGNVIFAPPFDDNAGPGPGASIFVPFQLEPEQEKTIRLMLCWYVPESHLRLGKDPEGECAPGSACCAEKKADLPRHKPWYAARFENIEETAAYWRGEYGHLRSESKRFSDCFYDTDLPPEVVEAVAANLTILKSPTVLRQTDGRLWCWEGCCDSTGCCSGSCTHVWNYAQALPHLFPDLERTLRLTEFNESQDETGHQVFRSALPIRPQRHDFHAAADGQLGGIMKVFREWRISGDTEWLRQIWPRVKQSLDYCIRTWDPREKGILEEPHHNTYDIEFWGPDGMCGSFYLGALKAAAEMGKALGDEVPLYDKLYRKGKRCLEKDLWNREFFFQDIRWRDLKAPDPTGSSGIGLNYSPEARELLEAEGPKYQYGQGCLSDGVLGDWLARVCGVGEVLSRAKVKKHLRSVYKYNFKRNLSEHANPQRPAYAANDEGGLILCSWPRGGKLTLPFPYSNEVWTGIEYHVASHLMMMGLVKQGLKIVQTARDRYDGRIRNPFNEYECGHWYARAMSSYGLLQGMTGIRYDAVEKVLYVEPKVKGDFKAFFSTAGGYGTAGVREGKPFFDVVSGSVQINRVQYTPG